MTIFIRPKDWYSDDYFWPNTRKYLDRYGQERIYAGPARDWEGFSLVANFLKKNLPGVRTIHDVGCSAGSFVSRAPALGFECTGIDISNYAVKNCIEGAGGKLRIGDISEIQPYTSADMVTAMDLLEHIYSKDLDAALNYMIGSIKSGGHFFACICTTTYPSEEWTHTSEDDPVPKEWQWCAVAGHVHFKPMVPHWIEKLESCGLITDYSMMAKFQLWREYHTQMSTIASWGIKNVYVGRKS